MKRKEYKDYEEYIAVQKSKTLKRNVRTVAASKFDRRKRQFRAAFNRQISKLVPAGSKVLCLGARRGEEIVAFMELGYDAVGVDLVATPPHVIEADFHDLPFDDGSFDLIFSNSVDHVFDLPKFTAEIRRVMRVGGMGLFHLQIGRKGDRWAALDLDAAEEFLVHFDSAEGFEIVKNESMHRYGGGLDYVVILRKGGA